MINKNLLGITISSLVARLGGNLVGIFIPLLLLHKGLALWQICAFYVGYALCKLCVNYPSMLLINRHGARLGLIIGYSAQALFMATLTLFLATGHVWLLGVAAVLLALQNSSLWNSQHLHISRVMDDARKNRDLALMTNLSRGVGIVAPLLGGFIAITLGQLWLTAIAALIVLLAIIPAWRLDKLAGGHMPDQNLTYSLKNAPIGDLIANFSFNVHTMVGLLVWPMYLAVFIPTFSQIGIVTSLAAIASVVVLQLGARRADRGKTYRVLVEGTAGSSLVHIGRVLATSNPVTITIISALYDIALDYQQNPWISLYYTHARTGGIRYIMSMEIACDLAYVALWGTLGVIAYLSQSTLFFTVGFMTAAVIAWLCLLVRREKPLA